MIKRTKYGEEVLGKIRRFRTFLMEVKKEELENIVEKDIQYYYQILPYAYVLGVSEKWMEKFKEIGYPPANVMGTYDFCTYSSLCAFGSSSSLVLLQAVEAEAAVEVAAVVVAVEEVHGNQNPLNLDKLWKRCYTFQII